MEGSLYFQWIENEEHHTEKFSKGESFLIPAFLHEYKLYFDKPTKYFLVKIPYIRKAK